MESRLPVSKTPIEPGTRPTGQPEVRVAARASIADLAAWLSKLRVPQVITRRERREAWEARREARELAQHVEFGAGAATERLAAAGNGGYEPAIPTPAMVRRRQSARVSPSVQPARPVQTEAPIAPVPAPRHDDSLRQRRARRDALAGLAPFGVPPIPQAPDMPELPELADLVALPLHDQLQAPVPAWVTADAPRLLDDPSVDAEGQAFLSLFRKNADGLSDLARLR